MQHAIKRLKQAAGNNQQAQADIDKVLEVIARSEELLNTCKLQVGMTTGEEIEEHLAMIKGHRFCSKQFNYERLPEGQ